MCIELNVSHEKKIIVTTKQKNNKKLDLLFQKLFLNKKLKSMFSIIQCYAPYHG